MDKKSQELYDKIFPEYNAISQCLMELSNVRVPASQYGFDADRKNSFLVWIKRISNHCDNIIIDLLLNGGRDNTELQTLTVAQFYSRIRRERHGTRLRCALIQGCLEYFNKEPEEVLFYDFVKKVTKKKLLSYHNTGPYGIELLEKEINNYGLYLRGDGLDNKWSDDYSYTKDKDADTTKEDKENKA